MHVNLLVHPTPPLQIDLDHARRDRVRCTSFMSVVPSRPNLLMLLFDFKCHDKTVVCPISWCYASLGIAEYINTIKYLSKYCMELTNTCVARKILSAFETKQRPQTVRTSKRTLSESVPGAKFVT